MNNIPGAPGHERFEFLVAEWDVTLANQMVQGREPTLMINVDSARQYVADPENEEFGFVRIDVDHALHSADVDLEKPLIAIQLPDGAYLVIDGWHRLYKAWKRHVPRLPCVVLTPDEEARVNIGKNLVRRNPYGLPAGRRRRRSRR